MKLINKQRGAGKSVALIESAHITGYPIIVSVKSMKDALIDLSHKMNYKDVNVYTVEEYKKFKMDYENVFIDEIGALLPTVVNQFLNTNVVAATLSLPMEEENKDMKRWIR